MIEEYKILSDMKMQLFRILNKLNPKGKMQHASIWDSVCLTQTLAFLDTKQSLRVEEPHGT